MQDDNSDIFLSSGFPFSLPKGVMPDGYVVGECIYCSEKGFTRIFKAKRGGRLFILKALREEYRQDPVAIAALRKEFDISFSIDIPGVVRTFDMISHPELGPCIVLQYYPGRNLRTLIDEGYVFNKKEIDNIHTSLSLSLEAIHRSGVIHRDVKPSNILYDPETASVTLIDFGCADAFDQLNFKQDAGTLFYKAPISLSGVNADRYALGVTFEELACCVKVSSKSTPTRRSLFLMTGVLLMVIGIFMWLYYVKSEISRPPTSVRTSQIDTLSSPTSHHLESIDSFAKANASDSHHPKEFTPENKNTLRFTDTSIHSTNDSIIRPANDSVIRPLSMEEAYRNLEWEVEYIVKEASEKINIKRLGEISKVRNNRRLTSNERDSLILLIVDENKYQSEVLKEISSRIEELKLSPRSVIVRSALYRHYDAFLRRYRDNPSL